MILKDLETVSDKPMKKENEEVSINDKRQLEQNVGDGIRGGNGGRPNNRLGKLFPTKNKFFFL